MTSQLHRLWCFFAYVSQLTHFLSVKNTKNGAAVTSSKDVCTIKFSSLMTDRGCVDDFQLPEIFLEEKNLVIDKNVGDPW
jgi:hypothetical protein